MTAPRCPPGLRAVLAAFLLTVLGSAAAAQSSADLRGDTSGVVAAYTISHGAVMADPGVGVAADKRSAYNAVEAYVWNALPPDTRSRVSRLELFVISTAAADPSDGTVTENDDGATWTLSLDEGEGESAVLGGGESDREVFDEVIAHETAHVLSLNQDQRSDGVIAGRYSDDEGPFSDSSYLNQFYQAFWKGHYPDWSADSARGLASDVYDRHPDSFVTEYAATDPSEDFAESFAYFVLDRRSTSQTERGAKLRFFYRFPELVKDRELMRAGLSSAQ